MHLESLEVWHWRGLDHVHLDGFSERLNLICGRNEAGKSRLFQALTFALFESFKGQPQYKRELQGWSSVESPRVAVVFVRDGVRYRIEKQFLKGGFALLEGGERTLKDEDAEDEVRRLLGTRGAGGARSQDPKDYGLWRLLWLDQEAWSRAPHEDLNDEPRATLQDRLAEQVGEVAGGPLGQRILERARLEAARYWTAKSGRATGELAAAESARDQARERRDCAVAERDAVHELSERLEQRRAMVEDLRRRLDQCREEHRSLSQEVAQLGELEARIAEQRREAAAREAHSTTARERLEALRQDEERRRRVAAEVQALEVELVELEPQLERAQAAAATARAAVSEAEAAQSAAREAERHARTVARARDLDERLARAAVEIERARERRQRLAQLRRQRVAAVVDPAAVEQLGRTESELERARARLEGAAVRLRLHALRDLRVDGEELAAGTERSWLVPDATTWVLDSVARLEVEPGGGEGQRLGDKVRDLEAELRRQLEMLGVADPATARQRLEERRSLDAQWRAETRGEGGGEGRDGGRAEPAVEDLEARRQVLEEERTALTETLAELRQDEALDVAAAVAAVKAADEAVSTARLRRDAALEPVEELRRRQAEIRGRREASTRETERLARAEGSASEEALEREARAQEARYGEALRRLEELEEELRRAGGDGALQQRRERLTRALEGLEEEHRQGREEVLRLEVQLETASREGFHDRAQESEQALAAAEEVLRRVAARAAAARRLLETLETERRASQRRLTEPVRRHLAPYLGELFPGSELALDEDWTVGGLTTGDTQEVFDQLSAGAREQLGILVRVALGEILAGDGRLPLILDDALVHSDPARRRALLSVLDRASRHLQVLVFTCHDESFDELGPQRRYRLEGGRAGEVPAAS